MMESGKRFQPLIHQQQLVGIQLILLFITASSCTHSSSSLTSEVGRSASYFKDRKISTFPHYEKYIMKPYFEKYDSLDDSQFRKFTDHELSFGSCEVMPSILNRVLRLKISERSLIGEGSHRHLSSTIRYDIQSEFISQLPKHFCEIIYIEKLPSGVFADPFELQHLLQRGVFSDAVVFGDTNLELPSVLSNRSLVEVHMDIGPNFLSRLTNGLDINIELPLHARYMPLVESGYSKVELGAPEFFMRCGTEEKSHSQSCLLTMKDDDAESRSSVIWGIPSGIETQARVVSVVTFTLAILSTLLIVLSSTYYSDIKLCKNLKQC